MAQPGMRSAMGLAAGLIVSLLLTALAAAHPARAAPRPLTRGFADDIWFYGPAWNARTEATGAKMALLEIDWQGVEPTAPPNASDATSPNGSQFGFGYVDAIVRQFQRTGITPVLLITDAPRWAQGPGGTAALYADGAWEPNATALGQFATALARRYSGSFPDPSHRGKRLPRVRYYQAWAEANINVHLSPQWVRGSDGSWQPNAPSLYRSMLNAFYTGIKRAHADNVVVATGLAPYGDLPGGRRIPPVQFLRSLLCLNDSLTRTACPDPAHFDVVAADPYEVGPPTTPSRVANDASAPDLGKLTRVVNRALAVGTALPRVHKPLWVTEFSYDSNPPNPYAPSTAKQARWLEESFYVFWREGVSRVFWYLIRDQTGPFATKYFSGVYFHNGKKKPSFEAYRFPLVVMASGARATVWGISPRTGPLVIQHLIHGRWQTLFRIRARAGAVFTRTVAAQLRGSYRAVVGGESSLVWTY